MELNKTVHVKDVDEMNKISASIAAISKVGQTITLSGELGVGKTTFARAFIKKLSPSVDNIPSPTFTLLQTYSSEVGEIWHFDLYRLKHSIEVIELGIEEAFSDGITLIEWPEIIESYLPSNRIDIKIIYGKTENERQVIIKSHGRS